MNAHELRTWFESNVRTADGRPYILDDDQAQAVVDSHKNTLVTARAGSGKTHTLVAKIIYLIAIKQLDASEIMAFVFNKDAAMEINERLRGTKVNGKIIVDEDVQVARTFHSFAHSIVSSINGRASFGKVLMDGEAGSDTADGRSLYIQAILSEIVNNNSKINDWIYAHFRDTYFKVDKQTFASPEEYYRVIRNHKSRTLDGRSVKSFSEKIISDFLFEHGVRYNYEPEYYPSDFVSKGYCKPGFSKQLPQKQSIKGDFHLPDQGIIWEHWAITGKETYSEQSAFNQSHMVGDYDEYKATMSFKKLFYSKIWQSSELIPSKMWWGKDFTRLVESTRDVDISRGQFERYLHELCAKHNIPLQEYSHEVLVKKAWRKQVKYFARTLVQFIDRTQQMYFDTFDELKEKIALHPEELPEDILKKRFYQIGITLYDEYLRRLSLRGKNGLVYINKQNEPQYFGDYGTDFSILLQDASKLLRSEAGIHHIKKMRNVKAILVDEFQDFSRLFYENLSALRNIYPESKLFCVGDNWQAINRFAGSEDVYYDDFLNTFNEDAAQLMLPTNYRSSAAIVNIGNNVMQDLLGVNSESFSKAYQPTASTATIKTIDLLNYTVTPPKKDPEFDADLQKYVEVISKIIADHANDERIIILHRRNKMLFNYNVWALIRYRVRDYVTRDLKAMSKRKFDTIVRTIDDTTDVMTVHKSKGLEAETVILLEVDPKSFPGTSSTADLFSLFGDNEEQAYKDEVRLLYVALTRAKQNLYVLWGTYAHKSGQAPDFINSLSRSGVTTQNATEFNRPPTNILRYRRRSMQIAS